ncbi:conserved hypothetical protein [Vibrio chagasii]|uniref:hypothetical protein n=1 Tax=Vibrio chagasii TaxID=170679 RepID=UPI001EFD68D2|nr:hypothetical protein [Vibrio chagasii]MDE9380041.1 hypothetical protein [Vibrio alginolyticus]MCG9604701.1 hypothetical protein [Vibrio chagasii]CAH6919093.1 conserved hypothetical protein [Vibrio chagasii]CAH6936554.1 conserved hypothetical protein [Vibrio chagasii]CAH7081270.1 conserved hypothetical protein [Vibrio chagasii]
MQISKVATAVALSTGLLFGCNSDGLPIPTDGSTDPATPTSALLNGYWEFSDTSAFSAAYSSSSSTDLPNVYRFSADGETLYYYTDNSADTTLGEYERFETTYEETIEDDTSGQVAFTLFNNDGSVSTISVDGDYSAADGGLSIGGNIPISGTDHSENTEVTSSADTADEASGINNAAQILDTLTDDTGELRLKILNTSSTVGKTISSGKLTVDLTYQLNPDSTQVDEGQNNSYISLYSTNDENDKVSNAYHHGDIAIGDGIIQFRDASGLLTATGGTFDANSTFDATVEVVWTPTSHTFTINGETYTGAVSSNSSGEVQVIALRLGTNSGVTPYELIADNLKVYSLNESTGEYVEEFKDTFNDYSVGYNLNNNPYNSSTSEAKVISLTGEAPVDPDPSEPTDNQVAAITDQDTSDTGELRYKFDSGMTTGTHKVSMHYDAAETESAYVSLFDSANSTSSLIGEFKIDEGKITLRGESTQVTTFTPGTWIDLEMSWDTSSLSAAGTYTVKVNGTEYGPYTSQNTNPGVEVTATAIKFSSNSGTADTTLYVDDYKVYSDTAGTTEIFSDDYENYSIGADLSASPYNSSTFSAVVAEDPLNAE